MAQQLALNCTLQRREGGTLHLLLDSTHAGMRTKNAEERLQKALAAYYNEPIRLSIQLGQNEAQTPAREQARQQQEKHRAAVDTINRDPNVQALRETFDAQVKPDSIVPMD